MYDQPKAESVRTKFDRVIDARTVKLPTVVEHLEAACAAILAFTRLPKEIWRQLWSNNPNERSTARSAGAPTGPATSSNPS